MSDFADPSVLRRIRSLQAVCGRIVVIGFRRPIHSFSPPSDINVMDLGRTVDRGYIRRLLGMLLSIPRLWRLPPLFDGDVVWARNGDMLILGLLLKAFNKGRPKLVYELLDIQRLHTAQTAIGMLIRSFERLARPFVRLLIVSSPAFVTSYFHPRISKAVTHFLWENKLPRSFGLKRPKLSLSTGKPLRLIWVAKFRCERSLLFLIALARRANGDIRIDLHGTPGPTLKTQVEALSHNAIPGITWHGRFGDALSDLAAIYENADLSWAIDMGNIAFNSKWLLPNKLYEAGFFGVPLVALADTELGDRVAADKIGFVLDDLDVDLFLERLRAERERLSAYRENLSRQPVERFIETEEARRAIAALFAGGTQ